MPAIDPSKINPRTIGKYPRSYDDVETTEELKKIKEDLEKVEYRAKLVRMPKSSSSGVGVGLIDRIFSIFKDMYYGFRDVLAGKKIKTALTILAGILIGAAAGAAIGTLVVPLIGTAGGAAVGAASGVVATLLPIIGGSIGLAVLGAVGGGWLGRFASKKLYPNEHRYELSKRITTKLRSHSEVNSTTAELMNGYLYNREQTARNKFLQSLYKDLRKKAFFYTEPAAMDKVAIFFCHELALLKQEIDPSHDDPELQNEINAVVTILKSLATSTKFTQKTSSKLEETLRTYELERQGDMSMTPPMTPSVSAPDTSAHAPKKKRTVRFSHQTQETLPGLKREDTQPLDSQQLKNVNRKFQDALRHSPHIKHVDVKEKKQDQNCTMAFQCRLVEEQKVKIIIHQEQVQSQSFTSGVYVEKANIKENQEIVADMLVKGAVALQSVHQERGQHHILTIDAGGDDEVAIQLMTAALKANLEVQLDNQEYPDTPEMNARREAIEREARRLTRLAEEPRLVAPAKRKRVDNQ